MDSDLIPSIKYSKKKLSTLSSAKGMPIETLRDLIKPPADKISFFECK